MKKKKKNKRNYFNKNEIDNILTEHEYGSIADLCAFFTQYYILYRKHNVIIMRKKNIYSSFIVAGQAIIVLVNKM